MRVHIVWDFGHESKAKMLSGPQSDKRETFTFNDMSVIHLNHGNRKVAD